LVSFAKEPYERDFILQKKPIILRSLPIVATPYKKDTDSERVTERGGERESQKESKKTRERDSARGGVNYADR